jgi:hypothetical protein
MCSVDNPPGQQCNAVEMTAAAITPSCVTGTIPVGTGGTIVDGTYALTEQIYYNITSCPPPVAETLVFSGGCRQFAIDGLRQITSSATFAVSGTSFTVTPTCFHAEQDAATVVSSMANVTFTATPTTFTLFSDKAGTGDSNPDIVDVFTRRQ